MINDEESLKSLFIKASQNLNRLQDSSIAQTNVSRQQQVKETVSLLKKCREMVNNLALFSVNEALEDIASNDMQFLLVDSHIALATLLRTDIDREILIKEALDYFNSFMDSLNTHEMLSQSDRQRWEAIKQGVKQKDPARFREEKIARYRREKATKEKMHELQELGDDDELQRELAITTIEFNVQRALDELTSLREEAEMLEYMKKLKTDDEAAYQQCIKETERSRGPNNIGPLMTGEGKPLRNFVIVNNRQRLHESVFGPDHALPTMSIDEYLQREADRGNVLSGGATGSTGQVGDRDAKPDPEGLGEEAEEAELRKQRAFDDWKDDHRRGEGNRMRHG